MHISEHHLPLLTPESDIQRRIASFQSRLQSADVALAWIDAPADLYYFTGSVQAGTLLIPSDGEAVYYAKKSLSRAEVESPLNVQPYPGRKGLLNRIQEITGSDGSLGLAFDVTPASTYAWLTSKLPGNSIRDIGMALRLQRAIKSDWELSQIQKAADQAATLFGEMDQHIRPGITELQLTASIEARMRELGHAGTLRIRGAADLVILTAESGDSPLYPSNFDGPSGGEGPCPSSPPGAGWKTLQNGETVIIDVVTSTNGYHSDQTRIYYLGETVPQRALEAHAFCLEVLKQLEKRMKPGAHCETVYEEVLSWAEERGTPEGFMGYGENRVKFFGHGVGIELDELPILARKIDIELLPGMVIAVEPKAYLKGIGAVGVENTYIITDAGCRKLCSVDEQVHTIR